jgi:hypothetical protein
MKRLYKLLDRILPILPYFIVFLGALYFPSDPDLGWHLKYGEYFFQHGTLLRENIYSLMMPHYQWADVSWLTDVITYAVFHLSGFFGLAVLSATIVTLTFFFIARIGKLDVWEKIFLFTILMYLEKPLNSVSFRGQQITLLLVSILLYLLSIYKEKPKALYLVIPLFLLWVNISGEFLLGLGLFAIWIITYLGQSLYLYIQSEKFTYDTRRNRKHMFNAFNTSVNWYTDKKKEVLFLLVLFLGSCLSTLINPFGIGVHEIAISHINSPLLKDIAEYLPFDMLSEAWWGQIFIAVLLSVSVIYFYYRKKLVDIIPVLICSLALFILSFEVRRYAWPAYYSIFPFIVPVFAFFRPNGKKALRLSSLFLFTIIFVIILSGKLPFQKFITYNWDTYCQQQYILCSPKSANYLTQHPQYTKNIFTLYGWGGWLIWNYPDIKPTIDGRMHLWRDKNGYSAFEDYYGYEQNMNDINGSKYTTVYISPDKPIYTYMLQLVQTGQWKKVYQDKYAGIFVKNK